MTEIARQADGNGVVNIDAGLIVDLPEVGEAQRRLA
jgi:hypothetical protein